MQNRQEIYAICSPIEAGRGRDGSTDVQTVAKNGWQKRSAFNQLTIIKSIFEIVVPMFIVRNLIGVLDLAFKK